MKTLPFSYQNSEIQFTHAGNDIMVNATQMAKIFDKRVDHFLKAEHVNNFIQAFELTPFGGSSTPLNREKIIKTINGVGTFMHRILALKFAAWLDPKFELWVFSTIDKLLMNHYRQHHDISIEAINIKKQLQQKEVELLQNPTYKEYAALKSDYISAIRKKSIAIKTAFNQIELELNNL